MVAKNRAGLSAALDTYADMIARSGNAVTTDFAGNHGLNAIDSQVRDGVIDEAEAVPRIVRWFRNSSNFHAAMEAPMNIRALCIFHGHGAHFLRRFLKPGFQHCFVAVASDDYWIVLDSKMGAPDICVLAENHFDLAGFYRGEGFTVIETAVRGAGGTAAIPHVFPLMLTTCVGMTKRLLGLSAPGVFTPWQLYRRLNK